MDDDQNLDDSIDSVILGGTLLQEQGGFPDTGDDIGSSESSTRFEEECESTIHFGKIKFEWTIKVGLIVKDTVGQRHLRFQIRRRISP